MALVLEVIVCSTRPGRIGPHIGNWFHGRAQAHGGFESRYVDLAEFDLPLYNEPEHPRLQRYQHAYTRNWSTTVAAADAFAFVIPEYNYGPPPSFVNALDYLYNEWNYKPCGFVSYGGLSGGMRAALLGKQLATTLKMMPMVEAVAIPMVTQHLRDGGFESSEPLDQAAEQLLDEMVKWAGALKTLR